MKTKIIKKGHKLWVARDKGLFGWELNYMLSKHKPVINSDGEYESYPRGFSAGELCDPLFEKFFGIKLKHGELKKVTINVTVEMEE